MPSASPSPSKRLLMPSQQSLSGASLVSVKPAIAGAAAAKQTRPHYVSRNSRNASHGRGLSNMGKKSMSSVYGEGGKHHKRSKSSTTTPVASPKSTTSGQMKRNSSHVALPKNRSHGNLRKNQSTNTLTALNRNLSRGALAKLGAPAEQKAKKEAQQKQGVFDLGNQSSEDEEAEWEDSTASPELTRDNSKVNTPARAQTPNGEPIQKPPDESTQDLVPEKSSSPPSPAVVKTNRSAPDLRVQRALNSDKPRQDPPFLQQQNGRSSRAPPAMTTANATSNQQTLPRNESQRSLRASAETSQDNATPKTPATPGTTVGTSSSGSAAVSHFLPNDPTLPRTSTSQTLDSDDDDDVSVSDFMANYKPQASESPEKPRTSINKTRLPSQPSRTQQKLELQRREVMRGTGPPPSAAGGMALSAGSSLSLHSRTYSHSKGRPKSRAGEIKAIKQEYETAVKQLTVVRRFRNPVLESLQRLKASGTIPSEVTKETTAGKTSSDQKRPPSRHGRVNGVAVGSNANGNGVVRSPAAGSPPEDNTAHRASKLSFASRHAATADTQVRPGGGRDSRVTFQLSRQGSHDDILTTSQGSPEMTQDDYVDGLSPEEALIRRMWESRVHVT